MFTYKEYGIYSLEFGFGIMKIKNYQDMAKLSHNLTLKYSKPKDFRIGEFFMHEKCRHSYGFIFKKIKNIKEEKDPGDRL